MYNKVIMIGNLTRDIDLKYLPSGTAIAKSAIATSHRYKTNDGEQKEEVCFLDFNVFGKSAEILNQYVKKGSKVLLEGRLVFESWVGPDGNNRNKHSLRVENFKFLDTKQDNPNTQQGYTQSYNPYNQDNQMQNNRTVKTSGKHFFFIHINNLLLSKIWCLNKRKNYQKLI